MKFTWHGLCLLLARRVPMNFIHVCQRTPRRGRRYTGDATKKSPFLGDQAKKGQTTDTEYSNTPRHRSCPPIPGRPRPPARPCPTLAAASISARFR